MVSRDIHDFSDKIRVYALLEIAEIQVDVFDCRRKLCSEVVAQISGIEVREIGLGGHARLEAIADESRQLAQRAALAGGAQERLVDQAFLVETQHIGHARIGVEQSNGKIVAIAGAQLRERRIVPRRQTCLQASENLAVGADAIGDGREPRPVVKQGRRLDTHAVAATAGVLQ